MGAEKNETGLYEAEIDGQKYEFEKWGAEEALSNLLKLSKILGKPLGIAFGAVGKPEEGMPGQKLLDKELDPNIIAMAIEALTNNLDEASAISLIKKLSSQNVFCNGAKIIFNVHYQDKLDHLFKVVYAALEVQYGNFFSAVLGLVGTKQRGVMKRASQT